jgi:4-carboxymuconolactone decarboxylase
MATNDDGKSGASTSKLWIEGMAIRKDVLGEEHVRNSLSMANDFTRPIQDLVTEYCWGGIWGRKALQRKTRSLLNIAMLTVMNRNHELGAHVRGAINNGCTVQEIQEVLLQTAIYVGVPASLESFRVADKILQDMGKIDAAGHFSE